MVMLFFPLTSYCTFHHGSLNKCYAKKSQIFKNSYVA